MQKQHKRLTYEHKIKKSNNLLVRQLLTIALEKKSNIALSADVETKSELLNLVDKLGSYICLLKTHIDIIQDFDWDLVGQLTQLSQKHNFLILEDRKFADIGYTTFKQCTSGIYKINRWANLVTAHGFVGKGLFDGLSNGNRLNISNQKKLGVFLLAQMSCDTPFFNHKYTKQIAKMATEIAIEHPELITGFIVQNPNFLTTRELSQYLIATPGVSFEDKNDNLGQKYNSPEKLIKQGSDILIIGRGIYTANNPIIKAKEYQQTSWSAYLSSIA